MDNYRRRPPMEGFSRPGQPGGEVIDDDAVEGHMMDDRDDIQGDTGWRRRNDDDTEGHATRRSVTDDDDTEGHAFRKSLTDDDDTEGHAFRKSLTDDDDTEGHAFRKSLTDDDEDTEGHGATAKRT
jgi:hypothetical protein